MFDKDNGAPDLKYMRGKRPDHGRNHPLRGHKSQVWEGGTRVRGTMSTKICTSTFIKHRLLSQISSLYISRIVKKLGPLEFAATPDSSNHICVLCLKLASDELN